MRKRFNKAIATLTLMMMILTLVMPVGAFAAPPADNPVYTFTESEANDGSFTEQFQVQVPDDDSGQAEILERDKIRVLEIYPNSIHNESERVNEMDVISRLRNDSDFEVTTISINRLISLKDDINGKYDVVYFNGGEYTRNYAKEHSYGSDITYCALLIEYIESGQLCIFHTDFQQNSDI